MVRPAHLGQKEHLGVQLTIHAKFQIIVHIIFPTGVHLDYRSRTDIRGHWFKNFIIPRDALNTHSHTVHVLVQVISGKTKIERFVNFSLRP
jgi:hypothetical protein